MARPKTAMSPTLPYYQGFQRVVSTSDSQRSSSRILDNGSDLLDLDTIAGLYSHQVAWLDSTLRSNDVPLAIIELPATKAWFNRSCIQ